MLTQGKLLWDAEPQTDELLIRVLHRVPATLGFSEDYLSSISLVSAKFDSFLRQSQKSHRDYQLESTHSPDKYSRRQSSINP